MTTRALHPQHIVAMAATLAAILSDTGTLHGQTPANGPHASVESIFSNSTDDVRVEGVFETNDPNFSYDSVDALSPGMPGVPGGQGANGSVDSPFGVPQSSITFVLGVNSILEPFPDTNDDLFVQNRVESTHNLRVSGPLGAEIHLTLNLDADFTLPSNMDLADGGVTLEYEARVDNDPPANDGSEVIQSGGIFGGFGSSFGTYGGIGPGALTVGSGGKSASANVADTILAFLAGDNVKLVFGLSTSSSGRQTLPSAGAAGALTSWSSNARNTMTITVSSPDPSVTFTLVPEPSSSALAIVSAIFLLAIGHRMSRRRSRR